MRSFLWLAVWLLVCFGVDVFVRKVPAWLHERQGLLVFGRGDWRRAGRFLARFGFLMPRGARSLWSLTIAEFAGRTTLALDRAEELLASSAPLGVVNQCVPTLVNGGRYRRALDVATPWNDTPYRPALQIWALLQVNVAEAEYNLGHWAQALGRLDRMRTLCDVQGIAKAGERQQRAWILVHMGRNAEARAAASEIDPSDFPRVYQAEYHFTLARIALAEGDATSAFTSVNAGLRAARRHSSTRNGLFLRARIRVAMNDSLPALADFDLAANMRYRGQGGDGLVAWGDLLRSVGREHDAQRAFALAVERDPESESAGIAAERLKASPAQAGA